MSLRAFTIYYTDETYHRVAWLDLDPKTANARKYVWVCKKNIDILCCLTTGCPWCLEGYFESGSLAFDEDPATAPRSFSRSTTSKIVLRYAACSNKIPLTWPVLIVRKLAGRQCSRMCWNADKAKWIRQYFQMTLRSSFSVRQDLPPTEAQQNRRIRLQCRKRIQRHPNVGEVRSCRYLW